MKKYIIVLILCVLLGFLFGRAAYSQENYFTPQQTMKASQEREASKENNSKVNDGEVNESKVNDATYYYYKQFTYPYYIESGDFFETKYALAFQNVKYPDVDFTLTYLQPYLVYSDVEYIAIYIPVMLECIDQNINTVVDMIEYCDLYRYEDEVLQTLYCFADAMKIAYNAIKDKTFKYIDAYYKDDFASCIKYMLEIQNVYWNMYVTIGTADVDTIKIQYEPKEE